MQSSQENVSTLNIESVDANTKVASDTYHEVTTPVVTSNTVVDLYAKNPDKHNSNLKNTISIYGSFSLAGTEFALSAESVQEVVKEPDAYSPIPLAPDYLLGVFNLRGIIVPVIDLRKLFSLEASNYDTDNKFVAILEHGDLCLGLLFDSTGEVFNGYDVEMCKFESRGDTAKEQVISGVFKMKGGRRIVQILDVHGMLKLDKIPQSKNYKDRQTAKSRGKRRQCISFQAGPSCCALDIGAIREIVNIGCIENTVLASKLCLGAIDIRGDTVPIVNFNCLLGYEHIVPDILSETDEYRVIVMKVQNQLVGLLVDSIKNIISYFDDEVVDFPVLVEKKKAMFSGCIPAKINTEHTILLKHSEVLSGEELIEITRGHSQLFHDSKEKTIQKQKNSLNQKTLLTFSLGNRYALDIRDVKEVIDYPSELIQTPNMAEHIRGMANIRGELIAVIDTRKLYNLREIDDEGDCKVLVFGVDDNKLGLVVDSVDSIVNFANVDVVTLPQIALRNRQDDLENDVQEAVMINNINGDETVCILNLDSVSNRAAA